MKAAWLVVLFLLTSGGLFISVASQSPNPRPDLPPAQSFDSPSSGSTWWVGASSTDASALPNTGVESVIQVVSTKVSGCLFFWVSDELTNDNWGQVGYFICDGSTPSAFYQVWNLNTQTVVAGGTDSVATGSHTFAMYLQSGTTWAYSLDGTVMGTYNMGSNSSSSSYPVYALSEEQASSAFSFPSVTFTTAMEVLRSGTWSAVQTAQSYGTAWGVSGAAQGGGLKNDQITVGGSLADLPQGTLLWGGSSSATTSTSASTLTSTFTSVTSTTVSRTSTTTQGIGGTQSTTATTTKSVTATKTTSSTSSIETVTTSATVTTSVGLPPASSSGGGGGTNVKYPC